jgi:hypothetical protein
MEAACSSETSVALSYPNGVQNKNINNETPVKGRLQLSLEPAANKPGKLDRCDRIE